MLIYYSIPEKRVPFVEPRFDFKILNGTQPKNCQFSADMKNITKSHNDYATLIFGPKISKQEQHVFSFKARQVTSDLEVGFLKLEKGKTGEELSKYMAFTFLKKGRYFTKT